MVGRSEWLTLKQKKGGNMFEIITLTATILSMVGGILNAKQDIRGFYLWIPSNLIWIVADFHKGIYFQALLFLYYFGTAVYGVYALKKITYKNQVDNNINKFLRGYQAGWQDGVAISQDFRY